MLGIEEPAYDLVFSGGTNFAVIDPTWIDPSPVKLNGRTVKAGDRFTELGNRRAAARFSLMPGHYLQYEGWAWVDKIILFSTDGYAESTEESYPDRWYYAFHYITDKCLLVVGNGNGHTIEWG